MSEVRIVVAQEDPPDKRGFRKILASLPQVGQVATPLVIAAIGGWYNCATGKQHDYQAAVQILNSRESSELTARSAAFDRPMTVLLDKRNHSIENRILTLETFLYNFHGIINARNLLADLAGEVDQSKPRDSQEWRRWSGRLRAIARGVANAQRSMIVAAMPEEITIKCRTPVGSASAEEAGSQFTVATGAEVNCTVEYPRVWYRLADKHELKIRVDCVGTHELLQQSCPDPPSPFDELSTSARITLSADKRILKFETSEFGTPFSDNTTIDHGHRIAILLRAITAKEHQLEVVAFPADLVPPGYQPTITNISRLLGGENG